MKTKNRILLIVGLASVVGITAWFKVRSAQPQPRTDPAQDHKAPSTKAATLAGAVVQSPEALQRVTSLGTRSWGEINQRGLDAMLATGDPLKWKPILGDLLNPHYKREEAIGVLTRLLENPDWDVRVTAASLLLELGSYAGVPVLQAGLHAAAAGELPVDFAEEAAQSLHRFRQSIDPDDLYLAYQRFKTGGLMVVAVMQQVPQMYDLLRQKRANRELGYDTEWMAAYLGMKDPESVDQYRKLLHAYPQAQVLGHWALYRALGRPGDLDYVIATARQFAGMEPLEEKHQGSTGTRQLVFDLLAITVEPRVTKALEEIADYVADHSGQNTDISNRVLTALHYVHEDDAFINRRALEFLRGQYRGPGVDRSILIKVAASRRTPEIDAAAVAFNPMAYEYALNEVEGRSAEKWGAQLTHVPISIVPPLPVAKP